MKQGRPLIDFLPDEILADGLPYPSLREARIALGVSQTTMARALGIGRTTWWRWETGRGAPAYPCMLRLALAFMATFQLSRNLPGRTLEGPPPAG